VQTGGTAGRRGRRIARGLRFARLQRSSWSSRRAACAHAADDGPGLGVASPIASAIRAAVAATDYGRLAPERAAGIARVKEREVDSASGPASGSPSVRRRRS